MQKMALISMDGIMVHWFWFLQKKDLVLTREDLTMAWIQRVGGRGLGNVYERICSLCQSTTVEEYVQEFETLVACMVDIFPLNNQV